MAEHGKLDAKDLLAAYELGLLDDADRARFEAASREDPELLAELFEAAPELQILARDPDRYARAARAALASAPGPRPGLLERLRAALRPRVLVPAAAVALALVLVVLGPGRDGAGLAELAVLEPLPTTEQQVRADAPAAELRFREAMGAYLDARWQDAAAGFAAALAAGGEDWHRRDQARLYRGSSLLLDGRPEAAATELEAAAEAPLLPVREQATWQLAQARLRLDDAAGARAALEKLRDSPVLAEKARSLLAELDQRR